jgi:hypothetical protein
MTIVNSSIKPKDQYEKNATFRIRFEQYDSTYEIQKKRIELYYRGDPQLERIMNDWEKFKKNELFNVIKAYLISESVPAPEQFVHNGKVVLSSPSVAQPAVAAEIFDRIQQGMSIGQVESIVASSGEDATDKVLINAQKQEKLPDSTVWKKWKTTGTDVQAFGVAFDDGKVVFKVKIGRGGIVVG